jgi:hypothetical protein
MRRIIDSQLVLVKVDDELNGPAWHDSLEPMRRSVGQGPILFHEAGDWLGWRSRDEARTTEFNGMIQVHRHRQARAVNRALEFGRASGSSFFRADQAFAQERRQRVDSFGRRN